MLSQHFDSIEEILLAKLNQSTGLGHPVDKGTAREIFIKDFLRTHLGENIGIGSGEIIDGNSKSGESRHQYDVILYRKDYPKLNFAHDVNVFLAESIVATIEIKSTLDKSGMEQAVKAAFSAKKLKREYISMWGIGSSPPPIRNYVFAYNGPENMETVGKWFKNAHQELGITAPSMAGLTAEQRLQIPSPALDGLIVLGKGALHIKNIELVPKGGNTNFEGNNPASISFINEATKNNLLAFFLWLIEAVNKVAFSVWDYASYLPKE